MRGLRGIAWGWTLALSLASSAQAAEPVVARVAFRGAQIEITAERLEQYAESLPEAPLQQRLDELVEFEILAHAASGRVGPDHPDVRAEVAPALVAAWLDEWFEREIQASTVPERYLRQAFKQNKFHFQHEPHRAAVHIVVTRGGEAPTEPGKKAIADELCQQIAESVAQDPPADTEAFLARSEVVANAAEAAGLEARPEKLPNWFNRRGPYDQVFAAEVFKLTEIGQYTPPFQTRFGCHVVRLERMMEARHVDYADAVPELRERTLEGARRAEFRRITDELMKRYKVQMWPERIPPSTL